MVNFLMLVSIVIFACVMLNKVSAKLGMPMLLAFIFLGMLFGSDGLFRIDFENYAFAENICSIALIFIIFYGGFGTDWEQARPVAVKAGLLSTLGVVLTAFITGIFCHYVFDMSWIAGLAIGSIIGSTDAASVFSILRSRKLNLKYNTASMLELESGSNDPIAYMLTIIFIQMLQDGGDGENPILMVLSQLGFGIVVGIVVAIIAIWFLHNILVEADGFDTIFVFGVAVLSYAGAGFIGGNGYLSAYITGIIMGNSRIRDKKNLVHFFDGTTSLMQMVIFFLLGLLSSPSKLPGVAIPAVLIFLFMTLVSRPTAVFTILAPFKSSVKQMMLVSFAGLRGAASIVFAIMAVQGADLDENLFHITFFIVLLSILFQGAFLPKVAKSLDMIDSGGDVMKTFTDYTEEVPVQFIQFTIPEGHSWVGKTLMEIITPPETIMVSVQNEVGTRVPNGQTILNVGDKVVLSAATPEQMTGTMLSEIYINNKSSYIGKAISEIPTDDDTLIILIKRGDDIIIPNGNIVLNEGDMLVMNSLVR
ncbi:MAG: potassium/proton antiporter [Catonella sp.]|uniref:potassium/proton antiporter n=1 Tax=Catonella sp. TaxID=2382125 RepID=UPI003FA0B36F